MKHDPNAIRMGVRGRRMSNLRTHPALAQLSEEQLLDFISRSLDLLCVAGLDGYFTYLNPAWTDNLGWTLEEMTGRPLLDFVHPDDRSATQAELGKLADGAQSLLFENRYRHQDGSYRWLQWNAQVLSGHAEIYASARDITRRKWLEGAVLEITDREWERLGRELHDGVCQSLAGIAALSSALSIRLASTSESAASAMAAEIAVLLEETIVEVRDLARDLARGLGPDGLKDDGLDGALEALALSVRHLVGVDCTFEGDRPFLRLPPSVESHLFRITREAVNNAVTHGKSDRIQIHLDVNGGQGLLCIKDNGRGMPVGAPTPEGIGLHTMAYRARQIGGSLEVRRRTPGGTAVTCAFPLRGPSDAFEV